MQEKEKLVNQMNDAVIRLAKDDVWLGTGIADIWVPLRNYLLALRDKLFEIGDALASLSSAGVDVSHAMEKWLEAKSLMDEIA